MGRLHWVLLAALLAGCGTGAGPKGGALDSGIAKLIPPDTVVLAGVKVQQVLKTPLYEKLAASGRLPPEMDEFARRTGLDVKRDLTDFYVASSGQRSLLIARVNLKDQAAVEKELESKGARRESAAGRTYFLADEKAVVFLDGRVVVAGPKDLVRAAVEGASGDDRNRKAVIEKLSTLPSDSHMWAVAVGGFPPMPLPERGNLANLNRVFASLQTTTVAVDLKDGVALAASGQCSDEKSAKQLHDTLRGLIGFGRLSTPADKPELLKLLDGIEVAQNKGTVNVNARVPADMTEFLLKLR